MTMGAGPEATNNSAPAMTPTNAPPESVDDLLAEAWPDEESEGDEGDGGTAPSTSLPDGSTEGDEDTSGPGAPGDDGDTAGSGEAGSGEPDSTRAARQQQAVIDYLIDPSSIKRITNQGERRRIIDLANVAGPLAQNMAMQLARRMLEEQSGTQAQIERAVLDLDQSLEEDPQGFAEVIGRAHPAVVQRWYQRQAEKAQGVDQSADQRARASAGPQSQQPPPQQQQGNGTSQEQQFIQNAVTARLGEIAMLYGQEASLELGRFIQEEGLQLTRDDLVRFREKAAEVEQRLSGAGGSDAAARAAGIRPETVAKRKAAPKPDINPGTSVVPGKYTKQELNEMMLEPGSGDRLMDAAFG